MKIEDVTPPYPAVATADMLEDCFAYRCRSTQPHLLKLAVHGGVFYGLAVLITLGTLLSLVAGWMVGHVPLLTASAIGLGCLLVCAIIWLLIYCLLQGIGAWAVFDTQQRLIRLKPFNAMQIRQGIDEVVAVQYCYAGRKRNRAWTVDTFQLNLLCQAPQAEIRQLLLVQTNRGRSLQQCAQQIATFLEVPLMTT